MMEYGESNNMKKVKNIDKDKWYLCTRPTYRISRKGKKRGEGLSVWDREQRRAEGMLIPTLLLMKGEHIINLKEKGRNNHYRNGEGTMFDHVYVGLIVVTEVPCNDRKTGRKLIEKNKKRCRRWCESEIENFEKQYEELEEQMNKDGLSYDEKYDKRNEFYKKLIY